MGLIQCTDCKGKVSDLASACPHCGRPFGEQELSKHIKEEQKSRSQKEQKELNQEEEKELSQEEEKELSQEEEKELSQEEQEKRRQEKERKYVDQFRANLEADERSWKRQGQRSHEDIAAGIWFGIKFFIAILIGLGFGTVVVGSGDPLIGENPSFVLIVSAVSGVLAAVWQCFATD
jgi:DNA mismatch repair ATPase MutL